MINDGAVAAEQTERPKKGQPELLTSRSERISYNTFWFGQNLLYMIVTTFLAVFYTGTLGIPAEIVGTILLVARLWDAVVDPILATIVERVRLPGGKFKPWVTIAAVSVPVITVFCFGFADQLSQQSMSVRILYASVTYLLWGTIYAASDGPAYALSTVMTPNPSERNILLTNNQFTTMLGLLTAVIALPTLVEVTDGNYTLAVFACAAISLVAMLPIRRVKERVTLVRETARVRDIWRSIVVNKYLMIAVVIGFITYASNLGITLAPFVATDIYGPSGDASVLLLVKIVPIIIVAPFGARLIRRFGKVRLMAFSFIGTAVLSIIAWFTARDSFPLLVAIGTLRGFVYSPQIFMFSIFFSDSLEYSQYKFGKRYEAATFATQTMMVKAGTAVAGGLAMWIIGLAGYQSSISGETVVQSAGAMDAMWASYNLASAIGSIVACTVLLLAYDMTENKLQEMVAANRAVEQ